MTVISNHRNDNKHLLRTMSGPGLDARNTEMKKIWSQGKEDGPKSRLRQRYTWNMGAQLYITILPSNATKSVPPTLSSLPQVQPPRASRITPIPLPHDSLSAS